jgi:cell wall integrity and stress response component
MSGGLIAAAVIASVLGIVIIGALIFFFLRRRRRDNEDEKFGGLNDDANSPSNINRNISTHSKAGLLERAYPPTVTTRVSSYNGPEMSSEDAISPVTPNSERRYSRPLMYDQRLNPNALMVIDNGSHTSLHTLDDHRDYGRVLKVCPISQPKIMLETRPLTKVCVYQVINQDDPPRPSIS